MTARVITTILRLRRPMDTKYSSDNPCGHPDNDPQVRVKAVEDPSGLPVPLTHAIEEGTRVFKMQEQRLAFERRSPCMHGMHAVPAMQVIYQKASIASCLSCMFIFSYPYFWVTVRRSSWGE